MQRVSRKTILRTGIVIVAIVGLHYTGLLSPFERLWQGAVHRLGGPTTDAFASVAFWQGWQEKQELERRIDELEARLQRNESSFARLNALEKENEELKRSIAWRDIQGQNHQIAKIIGKPFNLPNTFVIINRGTRDGVHIGQPAIINEDILIGKVVAAEEETATVRLLTDNKSVFSVRLSDGAEPIGRVNGQHGLSLVLDTVPATEELSQGDIIVTASSDIDLQVPDGLVIGTIEEVAKDPGEFFQSAAVSVSYDSRELSIVSIIIRE